MFTNNEKKYETVKEIRERQNAADQAKLKEQCEQLAQQRYGHEQMANWSNQNKGMFYLPILDEAGEKIEFLALFSPINRHVLNYASMKISDEGLYSFIEACMRETWIEGDKQILEDEEIFVPAAMKFNDIMKGRKAALLKR